MNYSIKLYEVWLMFLFLFAMFAADFYLGDNRPDELANFTIFGGLFAIALTLLAYDNRKS